MKPLLQTILNGSCETLPGEKIPPASSESKGKKQTFQIPNPKNLKKSATLSAPLYLCSDRSDPLSETLSARASVAALPPPSLAIAFHSLGRIKTNDMNLDQIERGLITGRDLGNALPCSYRKGGILIQKSKSFLRESTKKLGFCGDCSAEVFDSNQRQQWRKSTSGGSKRAKRRMK